MKFTIAGLLLGGIISCPIVAVFLFNIPPGMPGGGYGLFTIVCLLLGAMSGGVIDILRSKL